MQNTKETVNKLFNYLKNSRPERRAIEGHALSKEDNYTKNLYIRLLCLIACSIEKGREERLAFVRRIIADVNPEHSFEEYMRQSYETDGKMLDEFISKVSDSAIKYSFMLDALILVYMTESSDSEQRFAAELADAMRLTAKELEFVTGVCRAVLTQSTAEYMLALEERPAAVEMSMSMGYVSQDKETSYAVSDKCIILSAIKEKVDLNGFFSEHQVSAMKIQNRQLLYIRNANINMGQRILFMDGIREVVFKDCDFIGGGSNRMISFRNCPHIEFDNCSFKDFTAKTIYLADSRDITVKDCTFDNCVYEYHDSTNDWGELGGVIYQSDGNDSDLKLTDTAFYNCGGKNQADYWRSSIISNCMATIKNCMFCNCWHYSDGSKDPDDIARCLFSHVAEESNNMIENSAKLK